MSSQSPSRILRNLLFSPKISSHLSARFRSPSPDGLRAFEDILRGRHFSTRPAGFLDSEEGRTAFRDQLTGRLERDRRWFVPWVSSVRSLNDLRVLEIGCGTGSSTVALAEQGAKVTGLDIDEASLAVADERVRAYGLSVEFVQSNVTEFTERFKNREFDLVVFYASLEHMLHEERLRSMRDTWSALKPGSLWCMTDTPNRLWFLDLHTSRLPFFQWLPNDLALEFLRFSPRPLVRDLRATNPQDRMIEFLRKGRGVSYHEFELAIAPLSDLRIESCMRLHFRREQPLRTLKQRWSLAGEFEQFLRRAAPEVPPAFLLPSLDLILKKP